MIHFPDKIVNEKNYQRAVVCFKDQQIILPTFEQQRNPELIPEKIKMKLRKVVLGHTGLKVLEINTFRGFIM